jgi:Helix-turn-helix domain
MKQQTQRQRILKALKRWISGAEAYDQAGTLKLSTRVGELRKLGYDIESKWHVSHDFKIYRLKPKQKASII